ncbi:MAG: glycosyltransferase family 2 protein [candidate division WWE3 bacterium]|nr:glycosyltransferase family 2 protein [candidate division WWE3 bacterium]
MKTSIIIPCYNEEKNINRTFDGLLDLAKQEKLDLEIIAVNDGSKDKTWEVMKSYSKDHANIVGINQMGNFGQSCAYQAGFDVATGDYVLVLSADLEIPLENVTKVIAKLNEGYDFVNTNRQGRWGGQKAAKSGMANKLITKISGVDMKDRGSGLKGFRKVLTDNLKLYGEMHRFIPDYLTVFSPKMTEFEVEFNDRDFGVSAYKGNKRTIKVLLDLMTLAFMLKFAKKPFMAMPGRLFGVTGGIVAGIGFILTAYLVVIRILGQAIANRPLFTIAILMIIIGIQMISTGLIGELLMRTYFESSGRKTYVVRERVN